MDFYCLCCTGLTFRQHQICGHCEKLLLKQDRTGKACLLTGFPFAAQALWKWNEDNHHVLQDLILSLKGGQCSSTFSWLAEKMVSKFFLELYEGKRITLIPAPPETFGAKDHAFELSHQISLALGWNMYCGLTRTSNTTKQKTLNRKQRSLKKTKIEVPISITSTDWLIFVDDVITTGSTAKSGWEALGKPGNFSFWGLVERTRLRPD